MKSISRKIISAFFFLFFAFNAKAQTFTPTQIPSLVLWLRADSLVKDANNNVSSWTNCVGGASFDQSVFSNQPLWIESAICDMPVIRFDGSNDFLSAGDNYDIDSNSRTVFLVGKAPNRYYTFYSKATSPVTNRFSLSNVGDLFGDGIGLRLIIADTGLSIKIFSGTNPTGLNIWTNTIDRNSRTMKLYQNGVQKADTIAVQNSSYIYNSPSRFLLGAANSNNSQPDDAETLFLEGDIAEMIIYNRILSDSLRNRVELYLLGKYVDTCQVLSTISNTKNNFRFYISPNPASDEITITQATENNYPYDVYIYDITGKCVATHKNISDNMANINVLYLKPGYYFLKLTDQQGASASKGFIISR